jgi:RimJ/RimL family protein N-acetyltransferase
VTVDVVHGDGPAAGDEHGDARHGEIALVPVDLRLRARVLALGPHPRQRRYSGVPSDTLPPAERDPAQYPVAIVEDGNPVGFFALQGGPGAGRLIRGRQDMLLRAFFVDATRQGRGIAPRALLELPGYVRALDPAIRRVVLTVNVDNGPAIRTYLRSGFVDTGELFHGGIYGPQHVFALSVPRAPAA